MTGEPGRGPWRAGIAISDTTAGMFLGQGILLALLHRERTGQGQWVHTSLLEGMLNKLDFQGARYTVDGQVPGQEGNSHPTLVPMGTFEAKDGQVNICAPGAAMWAKLCQGLGAQALFDNPLYKDPASRLAHRHALEREIAAITRQRSVAELVDSLNPLGVPCGPLYDIGQAFEDAQAKHLRMTRPAHSPRTGRPAAAAFADQPVRAARTRSASSARRRTRASTPMRCCAELGYDAAGVASLRQSGAVA